MRTVLVTDFTKAPRAVVQRLTREACEHLGNPNSASSLRDLCRQFLKENPLPAKAYK